MTEATSELLIDNDQVRVLRVSIQPGGTYQPDHPRANRVVVPLTLHRTERNVLDADGTFDALAGEHIVRSPGDAVFRTASHHQIKNLSERVQISIIIELK